MVVGHPLLQHLKMVLIEFGNSIRMKSFVKLEIIIFELANIEYCLQPREYFQEQCKCLVLSP